MLEIPKGLVAWALVFLLVLTLELTREAKKLSVLKRSMFIALLCSFNEKAKQELIDSGGERLLKVETLIPYMLIEADMMGEYYTWLKRNSKKEGD